MYANADKAPENKSLSITESAGKQNLSGGALQFADNRPEAAIQRKMVEAADNNEGIFQMKAIANIQSRENTIQRYPTKMNDANAKALSTLHSTKYKGKEENSFSSKELSEIKTGVFMLTPLNPEGMQANCIGWALGEDNIEDPGSIYTWESDKQRDYTPVAPDKNAEIILWGVKDEANERDENKWDIRHASVSLSHKDLIARSEEFAGFDADNPLTKEALTAAKIPDPCWTSAGGFGYGIFVHPWNWFEGGDFGTALKGMKK